MSLTLHRLIKLYVRKLRNQQTQLEFATKVGLPQSTISKIEQGKRSVRLDHLAKIINGAEGGDLMRAVTEIVYLCGVSLHGNGNHKRSAMAPRRRRGQP